MKKPNLFNLIVTISICFITNVLLAAQPQTPKWGREALMATWVGKHYGLGRYEIEPIQEQLKLQTVIPLKIINSEVLSFLPRHGNEDAIEVTLQEAQTGAPISTTGFHIRAENSDYVTNPFKMVPEQKIINVPFIPVIANAYLVH